MRLQVLARSSWILIVSLVAGPYATAATVQQRYYAHAAVHDKHGVIAPWFTGQNGQCDFRVRVAAETLKRYPWVAPPQAVSAAPHYVFNGHWTIDADGTITPVPIKDWNNGDLGQRAAYVLSGLVDYYRYSGDPAAIAHITWQADALLDHCLTPADHPWPGFLVSVPTKGRPYAACDPAGMIQLDIVAEVGLGLLRAYQVTGNPRWLEACRHWGDLLAARRNREPGAAPWGRYANPESSPWKDDKQTGGVVFLLEFFDELIRLGYRGPDGEIVAARDAGRAWLRDELLPNWTVNDVWGRNYWDWADPVQAENVTEFAARYLMNNKEEFPNWRNDARNILSLFLNHTGVCPKSAGEVYSGAWAFPESCGCCGRSLWYGPMELAVPFAQLGVEADDPWARELARRMQILATYDGHETGVSEDNIDGGFVVNNGWFKIAHPMALKHLLATIAWMPEYFGPSRENHIVRSTAVVDSVTFRAGVIAFSTFDAPPGTTTVLRLAFEPQSVQGPPGVALPLRTDLQENGYTLKPLSSGDWIVTVRHDGLRQLTVAGGAKDPATWADPGHGPFTLQGDWSAEGSTKQKGASMTIRFTGNQVRLTGDVGPDGGLAEVCLDGIKQLVGIDYWNPKPRTGQIAYYRNGLPNGEHTLEVVALGKGNPRSQGAKVYGGAAFWSDATGTSDSGEGGGPTGAQRMVFGYTGREGIQDSAGNLWRPGTEFVIRLGSMRDSVVESWWTTPARQPILATNDPDLYRYGVHGREFCLNTTVGPGTYSIRLMFAAARGLDTSENCVSVAINGREVVRKMDVAATAGGPNRAVDLVFPGMSPRNGVIDVRFRGGDSEMGILGEAFVQAVEVRPGNAGKGATPRCILGRNLLRNSGFEEDMPEPEPASAASQTGVWQFVAQGTGSARMDRESAAKTGGPAEPGTGIEAVRVSGTGHSRLFQEIPVCPEATYRGSVWVLARDVDGRGFGRTTGDSAGVVLEELDAAGNLLTSHPEAAVTQAGPYCYVSREVTTTAKTASVRFVLDTVLGCEPAGGSVTYDQCQLDGPPAPAVLTGKVTDEQGRPLSAALVSSGSQNVRTDADGTWRLAGFSDRSAAAVHVEKQGYYPQTKQSVLSAGENRIDCSLVALPTANLLANGGFEGFTSARSMEHGRAGERGLWKFSFSPDTDCYIYPESIYTWRKPRIFQGKEAISHVTGGGGELALSQEVVVDPNTPLVASAWVLGLDVQGDGAGFGADTDDFAGIWIQELDGQGRVVADHEKAGIRRSTADFQRVARAFSTGPDTVKVRFILWSKIGCIWKKGAAIYDECALERADANR